MIKIGKYLIVLLLISKIQAYCQTDTAKYVYQRPLFDFSYDKPTFKLVNEQQINNNKFLRMSVLTGYREGVEPITSGMVNFDALTDSVTGTRKIAMFNLSIEEMFIHNTDWFPHNKVILKVKDPRKYRYDEKYGSKEEWMRKNTYCYEFIIPNGVMRTNVPNTLMGLQWEEDLQHLFGVRVTREKIAIKLPGKDKEEQQDVVVIREINDN